ncbi:hypothetical protein Tco_1083746 [Tanacetum coccineum]
MSSIAFISSREVPTRRFEESYHSIRICEVLKAQPESETEAGGKRQWEEDGQIFHVQYPDYLRDNSLGLVITNGGYHSTTLTTSRQRGCSKTLCNRDTLMTLDAHERKDKTALL